MKDRVPLYPGRVRLTPVSGQQNTYDMVRADKPTQEGDPLSKKTLLTDATAALYSLDTSAKPTEVLAKIPIYLAMLDEQMNRIINTILKARTNVLFFCTAGKDRTGVVSAVLLKRLGFGDDVIIEDYMKSKDNLFNYLTTYVESHPEVDIGILIPNEDNIRKVLALLNRRG